MYVDALLVGLLCGVVGVLTDLDHIVAYFVKHSGRVYHTHILIVASCVFVGLIAYLGGLLCS